MKTIMNTRVLLILLALAASSACTSSKSHAPVVARLGDTQITADEFRTHARRMLRVAYHDLDTLDMQAKRQLLRDMITQRLIVMEALRRGLDRDTLIADRVGRLEQRALIDTLYARQATQPHYSFTEKEIRDYYHKNGYDTEVLTEQIVCATADSARQALAELHAGKSFAQLVPRYTLPHIQRRFGNTGNIGWFLMADMLPALRAPVSTMEIGALTPQPVRSRLGYHIFRLNGRRTVPLDSVRTLILKKLDSQRRMQDRRRYNDELRKRYGLQAHPDVLTELHALPGNVKVWPGSDKSLYTWKGGQYTCRDYMALHRLGRVRHPSSLDLPALQKLTDNLAGQQIMKTEARRLGYDRLEAIRKRVARKRDQLLAKEMYKIEGRDKAAPVGEAQVDSFLKARNDSVHTRDARALRMARRRARHHLRGVADDRAMDAFIDSLRTAYQDRIQVFDDVLATIDLKR